jgi:hypothetical protein
VSETQVSLGEHIIHSIFAAADSGIVLGPRREFADRLFGARENAADRLDAHALDVAQTRGEIEHDRVYGFLRGIEIALGERGLGLGDAALPVG